MIYPSTFEKKIGFDFVRNEILRRCTMAISGDMVKEMSFSTDFADVASRLRAVAEMQSLLQSGTPLPFEGASDITQSVRQMRVPGSFIPASEFHKVAQTLRTFDSIARFFASTREDDGEQSSVPELCKIAEALMSFPLCLSAIERIVDRFGNVRDDASVELSEIRRSIMSTSGSVNNAMRRVMARAIQEGLIDGDAAPTMRDGRLVLPVPPMNKRKISGIVHDESASGKTVFIEPAEVVSANNRIRELQIEERREIARLLLGLADTLRPHLNDILLSMTVLGELDFITAKALFANDSGGHLPSVHETPDIEWYHACHPGLEHSLRNQGKEIVPLNITLNQDNRILVISGPNAGGKSICLKTVGIIQYMAQCGVLPTLYENSHIGIFTDIFVDIGDDQSLEDDLSTYSSHLRNMKLLLHKGSSTSLLLVDEFGSGTEPQIGGLLAQAILRQLNARKMWGVVTTHYQNLKQFAEETDGLINGSMLYDRHRMMPLFTLSIGSPGSSFALEIARKIGLPASVIADAEELAGSDYVNLDRYLLDIARDRRYWENKRQSIRMKEKKVEEALARYEEEADTLREKRRDIINDAREEARRILDGSNAAIERTISAIRSAQAERERTLEERRRLNEEKASLMAEATEKEHPLLHKAPKSKKKKSQQPKREAQVQIAVGDVVKLDGEGSPGKVLSIDGKKAVVAFGMLKTTVELARLRPTSAKMPSASNKAASFVSSATTDSMRQRQLNFSRDIDVRGMRVDEAVQAVTYFIDDAVQFSADRVRILHGTGTGALRQYIRNYLSTVPGVRTFHDEHVQFGGAGITVVELG